MYTSCSLFFVVLIVATVQSQNYNSDGNAKVLKYVNNVGEKNYDFSFDTENQIHQDENGYWTGIGQAGPDGEELGINHVTGYATYVLQEGTPFSINYNADENGFRPSFVIGSKVARNQAPGAGSTQGSQRFSQVGSQQFSQQSSQQRSQQAGQQVSQFGQRSAQFGQRSAQFNGQFNRRF